MNLIRSLMGRRQFLVAAGVTSTSALAFKKLAGVVAPGFQTGVAMASDRPGTAGKKGEFSNRYSHLLSPIKIGNVVLKNRMLSTKALPHYLQGPETFPADAMIYHYANVAKNGAAVVTVPRQALQPKRLKTYVIPQLRLLLRLSKKSREINSMFYE